MTLRGLSKEKKRRARRVAFIWSRPPPPGGRAEHTPSVLMRTVGFPNGFLVIPAIADRDLGGTGLRKLGGAFGLVAAAGQRGAPALGKLIDPGGAEFARRHGRVSEYSARSRSRMSLFVFLRSTHIMISDRL